VTRRDSRPLAPRVAPLNIVRGLAAHATPSTRASLPPRCREPGGGGAAAPGPSSRKGLPQGRPFARFVCDVIFGLPPPPPVPQPPKAPTPLQAAESPKGTEPKAPAPRSAPSSAAASSNRRQATAASAARIVSRSDGLVDWPAPTPVEVAEAAAAPHAASASAVRPCPSTPPAILQGVEAVPIVSSEFWPSGKVTKVYEELRTLAAQVNVNSFAARSGMRTFRLTLKQLRRLIPKPTAAQEGVLRWLDLSAEYCAATTTEVDADTFRLLRGVRSCLPGSGKPLTEADVAVVGASPVHHPPPPDVVRRSATAARWDRGRRLAAAAALKERRRRDE